MDSILKQTNGSGDVVALYQTVRILGSGGFATVHQVISLQTSIRYAAKTVSKQTLSDKVTLDKLKQQIRIHKRLNHKHIVKFERAFQDSNNVYLLMELCQHLTLKQLQKTRSRLTQIQVRYYTSQLIGALEYMHLNRVLHRDMKLGNVFIDSKMQLKLGDFGLSVRLKCQNQMRETVCGTPNYIAPEILEDRGHSFAADVWALGVLVYTLLVGKPPFERDTVDQTYESIKTNDFTFPLCTSLSVEAKSFIQAMLQQSPNQRPSLSQLRKHEFMDRQIHPLPQSLPVETLREPPSLKFLREFSVNDPIVKISIVANRLTRSESMKDTNNWRQKSQRQCRPKHSLSHRQSSSAVSQQKLQTVRSKMSLKRELGYGSTDAKTRNRLFSPRQAQKISFNTSCPRKVSREASEHVIAHVDWSGKYGVGYILTSGTFGIAFNDKTSLARIRNAFLYSDSLGEVSRYEQKQAPSLLIKKIKILRQVQEQLRETKVIKTVRKQTVFVKRFLRHDSGVLILKLSNGTCQFVWDICFVILMNYKEIHWKYNTGREGRGTISDPCDDEAINDKVRTIRSIVEELSCQP